jgi:fructose-bisphosphate aldolase / 6-deoxy-5-ketofructose 1-phosphate synthase
MKSKKNKNGSKKIYVPLTVPLKMKKIYLENYRKATLNSGNLFLFAGDQKIEHLNKDFHGNGIPHECETPEHFFKIASHAKIGAFASQLGLIAKYASDYKNVNYVIKLNSKTNLVTPRQAEPISTILNTVDDVIEFQKNTNLSIVGVGYTIYLGSQYEHIMLHEAAQIVLQAHKNGLLVILWMYPRGKAIENEKDADLIAGAAGVGACLGADFVKINPPYAKTVLQSAQHLKQASLAAGRTKVVCSGGEKKNAHDFLDELYLQIKGGGVHGCAVGRNIHQKTLKDAIKFCDAIAAIVIDGADLERAEKFLD